MPKRQPPRYPNTNLLLEFRARRILQGVLRTKPTKTCSFDSSTKAAATSKLTNSKVYSDVNDCGYPTLFLVYVNAFSSLFPVVMEKNRATIISTVSRTVRLL